MRKKLSSVELIYHVSSYQHLGHVTNYEAATDYPIFTYAADKYQQQKDLNAGNAFRQITNIIHQRHTTRSFKPLAISRSDLLSILFNAYALKEENTFTIPQAGNLPLMKLVVLEKHADCWQVYRYHPSEYQLIAEQKTQIEHLFFTKSIDFASASHCIIITSLLNLFAKVYLTRAYKFACLQAGHIAQNIVLSATSANLAAVTLGSLIEETIIKECTLLSDEFPLYAVVLGRQSA